MFNFFGLCSGTSGSKLKSGDVGIHVYNSDFLKKRQILPTLASSPQVIQPKNNSLKTIFEQNGNNEPVSSFKQDSNKLTETTGDQYTFLRTLQKSNFEELNSMLKNKNEKFTDPEFPPNNKSLGDQPHLQKNVQKWVRVTQLYKNPVFFSDGIEPNDVIQGYTVGAGNCYFLSAISNLARNPSRIKQIFGNTEISKEGIYYVKLFHQGVFKQIVVDDFIPVSSMGPMFARPPQGSGEIWVQILQKSYAKLFGSYNSMNGGLPSEAHYALTGAPTFFYSLADYKETSTKLWNVILEAYNKNYCVDCGTSFGIDQTKWIKQNHAYTMLGAFEVQNFKLIKLRNPMGRMQWNGKASDYDVQFWDSITPQNKKIIGYEPNKQNDGIFYMLWQDFPTYFSLFQVCQYKDNANVLSLRQTFTMKNANMFQVQTKGGEVIFSLAQDSQRGTGVELKTFKYSKSYFVIAKLISGAKGQQNFKIVKLASKNQFYAHHQRLNLQPGTYIAYCKYQWIDNIDKEASFIVYSDSPVRIRQAKQSQYPEFLQTTFMSIPKENSDFIEPKQNYSYVKKFYGQSGGYGFYAVRVKRQIKGSVQIEIDEQQLKQSHLILKKPFKNKGKSKIVLKAGEEVIIVFRSKDVIIPQNLNVPDVKITFND